jgi:predicted ribosomally synthesized peptide with SipW-like signal peptide
MNTVPDEKTPKAFWILLVICGCGLVIVTTLAIWSDLKDVQSAREFALRNPTVEVLSVRTQRYGKYNTERVITVRGKNTGETFKLRTLKHCVRVEKVPSPGELRMLSVNYDNSLSLD